MLSRFIFGAVAVKFNWISLSYGKIAFSKNIIATDVQNIVQETSTATNIRDISALGWFLLRKKYFIVNFAYSQVVKNFPLISELFLFCFGTFPSHVDTFFQPQWEKKKK